MNAERSRRPQGWLPPVVPVVSDICAILSAWVLTTKLVGHAQSGTIVLVALVTFLLFQLSAGSYRLAGLIPVGRECGIATRSFILGAATVSTFAFFSAGALPAQATLLSFFLFLPPAFLLWHAPRWYWSFRARKRSPGIRTMIVGPGPGASRLSDLIKTMRRFDLVAVTNLPAGVQAVAHSGNLIPELKEQIIRSGIELLLISFQDLNGSTTTFLDLFASTGVQIRLVPSESEFLRSEAGIEDLTTIPVPSVSPPPGTHEWIHRAFDLACSLLIAGVLSPVLLLVACAVRMTSAGPVFFKQQRSINGLDTPFMVYKFRSMNDRKSTSNGRDGQTKIKDDPRVTALGRLMRRYSIDELPQLLNIFRGEMSLVGPRPLPEEDFEAIRIDGPSGSLCSARSGVKPGLTGLWQISGRSDLGFREMLLLDIYYIENRSVLFDLEILLRTVPAVLFGKGAY